MDPCVQCFCSYGLAAGHIDAYGCVYGHSQGVPCGWIRYSDFEINQGVRGCFPEADRQRLDRCERAPVAQASWAGLPRVF